MRTARSLVVSSSVLCALALTAHAQHHAATKPIPPPPIVDGEALLARDFASLGVKDPQQLRASLSFAGPRELAFDVDEHGATWVRGDDYKARFDARGVSFMPFLGASAPRNFPLDLWLARASIGGRALALTFDHAAVRADRAITIERGAIDERYEIEEARVEQTFVVDAFPGAGDLRLFVAFTSELAPHAAADGFTFRNEWGGVDYGRACVRNADGTLTHVPTSLVDGGIEIVISASELARASYPLVIDPVITTFAVEVGAPFDDQYPDVAYDFSTDRYLFVMQDAFSATDFDVYARLISSTGTNLGGGYVDSTAEVWFLPKVAGLNINNSFLAVATTGDIGSATNRRIKGRITTSASVAFGAVIDISGAQTDYNLYPDVGGDPYDSIGTADFCVGWQRTVGGLDQVVYRIVSQTGVPEGANPTVLHQSAEVKDVSVSNSNNTTRWNIAWDRCPSFASDCDVFGAQVNWNGTIATPFFAISNVSQVNYAPSASSPQDDGRYMVVWTKDAGANTNIEGALLSGSTVLARADLTVLEAADPGERQVSAKVDACDRYFAVAYAESYNGSSTDYDPYVATFAVIGGTLTLAEGHQDLAFTNAREDQVALCAERSGGVITDRFVCAWRVDAGPTDLNDVRGAFYDGPFGGAKTPYCFGDGTGTACPCGNSGGSGRGCANSVNAAGALLDGSGHASKLLDTLVLISNGMPPTASCLFFQGTVATNGALGSLFGDGLRCASGTVVRLGTKTASGGVAAYPGVGDPSVSVRGVVPASGGVRYYQAWYRNPIAYCTSSPFNLSNGLRVTWLP